MATTKSSAKASPAKRPAPAATVAAAKVKAVTKTKSTAKAKPAVNTQVAQKGKAAPKAAAGKAVPSRRKQPAGVPLEQRRNYIEMAAYYIAERRGFAPGNLLDDWVQAEAEIDRLLAEGRLGG